MDLQEKNKKSLKDFKKWLRRKKEMEEANSKLIRGKKMKNFGRRKNCKIVVC